ncbi:MAG: deoxyribodipyrimidine photo-lyase [Actinobacteria bacterium]|nr:deoxyribodipyrimidine photo-lyase [Actinomycetota bacterium]
MKRRSIFWFRRDLRLADNPALLAAIAEGDEVLPLFIVDENIAARAGEHRRAYLAGSLKALNASLQGNLHVISGDPVTVLHELVGRHQISSIHVSADFAPYGVHRDRNVEASGLSLIRTGSPYAVAPGRVRKSDDTPYRVYTPFFRAWTTHGWRLPVAAPSTFNLISPGKGDQTIPNWSLSNGPLLQDVGEAAALERWKLFQESGLKNYDTTRDLPGVDGTSRLSAHLRWGEIHPRTLLAALSNSPAHEVFRKEIAWREFYADVLHHNPHTSRDYYVSRFAKMRYDQPEEKFRAWCEGKTGFPFVDAAMRQLVQTGWMHNRARMVVASFLVKDLHLEWQHGANFFMKYLIDNDVASNSHGWQWTAGCGTDASPYYRIFNPIEQGKRFDPAGDYIREFVPELHHLSAKQIHEPWLEVDGYKFGYPVRIVDHSIERLESLARLAEIKAVEAS